MKILLVEPDDRSIPGLKLGGLCMTEPISLELVAAAVPEHEVMIVDLRLDDYPLDHYLYSFKPEIVGVTGVTALHNEINYVLEQAKKAGSFTVAGGPHASFAYQHLTNADAVVIGEGEGTFRDLVHVLNSNGDLSLVPNLAWRDGQRWIRNNSQNYELWPLPRRCLARDYRYTAFGHPAAMVEATRGCPHRCSFCLTPKLFRGRYRVRPVGDVVDYLNTRPEPVIIFLDPDFMASPKYVASLLGEIRKRKLSRKYLVSIRADEVVSNPELIHQWGKGGLLFAFIGYEAYTQQQLNSYNKDSVIDYNTEAVSILHETNIISIGTFIVEPSWSSTEFDQCLQYAKRLGSDITFFSILTPFPGTPIYDESKVTSSYDKFDVLHAVTETVLPYDEFQKNHSRISKAVFLSKATLCLLWRLWRRKFLNLSSFLPLGKLFTYIAMIDKKLED